METESKISQFFTKIGEKLNEQVWFQQLKTKWEELDPQSRSYLKYASAGTVVALVLFLVLFSVASVNGLNRELQTKNRLLTLLQNANDEIRRLKDSIPAAALGGTQGGDKAGPWAPYLESTAATAGIDKASMVVS